MADKPSALEGWQQVIRDLPSQIVTVKTCAAFGGYFEDGSTESFSLCPDDATRTWHVMRNGKTLGYGNSIEAALLAAIDNAKEGT